jgi:acyl carrier protein phosphodiesterase
VATEQDEQLKDFKAAAQRAVDVMTDVLPVLRAARAFGEFARLQRACHDLHRQIIDITATAVDLPAMPKREP